jgi:hypothetical protein
MPISRARSAAETKSFRTRSMSANVIARGTFPSPPPWATADGAIVSQPLASPAGYGRRLPWQVGAGLAAGVTDLDAAGRTGLAHLRDDRRQRLRLPIVPKPEAGRV